MPGERGTPVRGSRADSAEQGKCVPTTQSSEATRPCDGTHGSAPSLTPLFSLPGRGSGLRYGNSRLGRSHTATQSVRREKERPGSVPAEGSRGDSGPGHAPAPRSPLPAAPLPAPRVPRSRDRAWAEPGRAGIT